MRFPFAAALRFPRMRLARVLAAAVTAPIAAAAMPASAADVTSPANLPVSILPNGEDNAVFGMSLGQWETYSRRLEEEKIDDARALAAAPLAAPRPVKPDRPYEVWSRTEVRGIAVSPLGENHFSEIGTAVDLGHSVKVGAASAVEKSATGETATDRIGLEATVDIAKWQLKPQARLVDRRAVPADSTADDRLGSGAEEQHTTRLELAPELRRSIELEAGGRIEPFLNMRSSLELVGSQGEGATETPPALGIDEVGVGLTLTSPDSYRFEATADIERPADMSMSEPADASVRSRVKLTVPLD